MHTLYTLYSYTECACLISERVLYTHTHILRVHLEIAFKYLNYFSLGFRQATTAALKYARISPKVRLCIPNGFDYYIIDVYACVTDLANIIYFGCIHVFFIINESWLIQRTNNDKSNKIISKCAMRIRAKNDLTTHTKFFSNRLKFNTRIALKKQ